MDEKIKKIPHSLVLSERNKLTIDGITDVGRFDDENLTVFTSQGEITLKGENLQVTELNIENGSFSAEGKIISIVYSDKTQKHLGFISKVFK